MTHAFSVGRALRAAHGWHTREHVQVVVGVEQDLLERGRLLLCRAQAPVEPEDAPWDREEDEPDHHGERNVVANPRVWVRVEQRSAHEVADAFERVLPAGEQRDQLEQLRLLRVGRHKLGDCLAAELREILGNPAQHLRERHKHDGRALLPFVLPTVQHRQAKKLKSEPDIEGPANAPPVSKHARRDVSYDARKLVKRKHDGHFLWANKGAEGPENERGLLVTQGKFLACPPRSMTNELRGRSSAQCQGVVKRTHHGREALVVRMQQHDHPHAAVGDREEQVCDRNDGKRHQRAPRRPCRCRGALLRAYSFCAHFVVVVAFQATQCNREVFGGFADGKI